ncbi:hypothetical protein T11_7178 [Trichinella zimbabwensis]|uniref:Uncharacterized protein n=1 Tax=Trichinella zimbabwensis TaxID=268475 RepID=A0A0V1HBB1_9BILA|nr:hypothetical protein T11_7178 [Trichinella zimbabwensis]
MSLVHQIQPKHSECRKLVKKFLKFDKTLKSLLAYGKKSQILYTRSTVSINSYQHGSSSSDPQEKRAIAHRLITGIDGMQQLARLPSTSST